ncbi:MAG: hypothetical protein A2Z83_04810 [Omnitrophica bacterium GWA2_52_8]|nr:MAG: hypothetical protein A2Z83_04810 [Omnitrophica bacterium GWA2_52_8]
MSEFEENYHHDAEQLFQQAYQKQMSGNLDEAIALYLKSIELFPTAEAHTFLGWAYSAKGNYDGAISECRRAIEIDPDFGNPYNDIGAYLIEKGRPEEAIPWLEKAVRAKRYDSYCFPLYNLGRTWEMKGDWQKAYGYYQKSLSENAQYLLAKKAVSRLLGLMN